MSTKFVFQKLDFLLSAFLKKLVAQAFITLRATKTLIKFIIFLKIKLRKLLKSH